jgi:hypothetical protein
MGSEKIPLQKISRSVKLTSDLNIILKARVRASIPTLPQTTSILSFMLQSEAQNFECDMEEQLHKASSHELSKLGL